MTPSSADQGRSGSLAAASFAAGAQLPSTCVASSTDLHWETVLAREYLDPEETEGFTTGASPDLLIVFNLGGTFQIESERPGGWSRAAYRPGSIGATTPGRTATLRWQREESDQRRSLHLHLSARLLQDTADSLEAPGLADELPDALLLDDPVVAALGGALKEALDRRAEGLHADALAQALALHVLYGRDLNGLGGRKRAVASGGLAGTVVPRLRDYLHEHLADEVRLDDLAREVSVSKFHLLRVFAKEVGETPHAHLIRLRMKKAEDLLRSTDFAIHRVAIECGYRSAGQFARTFRRHFGASPGEYRRHSR